MCRGGLGEALLETARSHAHDDQTDRKTGDRTLGMGDHVGNGGDDQNQMAEQSGRDGVHDGAESTPVLIGQECSERGHDVGPKGID